MLRLCALLLLVSSFAFAQAPKKEPPALTNARRSYEASLETARKQLRDDIAAITKSYHTKLKELQTEITKQGDLDAALAVRAEIDRTKGNAPVITVPSAVGKAEDTGAKFDGDWDVWFPADIGVRVYRIGSGSILYQGKDNPNWTDKIKFSNGQADIGERPELWKMCDDGQSAVVVMYFGEVGGKVRSVGFAVRKK